MGIKNRQIMPETVGNGARLYWKAMCRADCSALEEGGGEKEGGEVGGGGEERESEGG
jgi:hypothetical protein